MSQQIRFDKSKHHQLRACAPELLSALIDARQLIRQWHGMNMDPEVEARAWEIYENHAPEMQPINKLINRFIIKDAPVPGMIPPDDHLSRAMKRIDAQLVREVLSELLKRDPSEEDLKKVKKIGDAPYSYWLCFDGRTLGIVKGDYPVGKIDSRAIIFSLTFEPITDLLSKKEFNF